MAIEKHEVVCLGQRELASGGIGLAFILKTEMDKLKPNEFEVLYKFESVFKKGRKSFVVGGIYNVMAELAEQRISKLSIASAKYQSRLDDKTWLVALEAKDFEAESATKRATQEKRTLGQPTLKNAIAPRHSRPFTISFLMLIRPASSERLFPACVSGQ